jgi:hypothetical protein
MLEIIVPGREDWDERTNEFVYEKPTLLRLEHSLLSLSKWESKWHKPWLDTRKPKTQEEMLDYIRCMTVTQGVDPKVYTRLTRQNMADIKTYMDDPMSATWFNDKKKGRGRGRVQTAELFYCAMASYGIPFGCEKWHLNRLLTLLRVCGEENSPKQKMTKREEMMQRDALNNARRAKYHTKG